MTYISIYIIRRKKTGKSNFWPKNQISDSDPQSPRCAHSISSRKPCQSPQTKTPPQIRKNTFDGKEDPCPRTTNAIVLKKKIPTKSTTLFSKIQAAGRVGFREGTPSKARTRGWNYSDIVTSGCPHTLPEGCCPLRLETPCATGSESRDPLLA